MYIYLLTCACTYYQYVYKRGAKMIEWRERRKTLLNFQGRLCLENTVKRWFSKKQLWCVHILIVFHKKKWILDKKDFAYVRNIKYSYAKKHVKIMFIFIVEILILVSLKKWNSDLKKKHLNSELTKKLNFSRVCKRQCKQLFNWFSI